MSNSVSVRKRLCMFVCVYVCLHVRAGIGGRLRKGENMYRENEAINVKYFQTPVLSTPLFVRVICFLAVTVCLEAKEDESKGIDITADEELRRVGEDEQLVGQILCDIAEGWKQRAEKMSLKREDQVSYRKFLHRSYFARIAKI